MHTDLMSKRVLILCDHDALYAVIELQLSSLPEAQAIWIESGWPQGQLDQFLQDNFDLMIVASISPAKDPIALLSKMPLPVRVGDAPVLVISEQPSRPESEDQITYLNFPFDIDQLTHTVRKILDKRPKSD